MFNYIEVFYESTGNHYVGSLVKGKIVVKNPSSYTSVLMSVSGKAQSLWREEYIDGKKKVYHTNSNTEKYIEDHRVIWSIGNSYLPTDKHTILFEYQLPHNNVPPSFEGIYGWVRYKLSVSLNEGCECLSHHTVQLVVQERNNLLRLYQEPKSVDIEKRVFFGAGSITATCAVPRTGFSPGESIPLTVHVENKTSRNVRVNVALVRHDTFIAPENFQKWAESLTAATSPEIPGGQTADVNFDALVVPKQSRVFTTMRSCSCITVEYSLLIKLVIPWSFNKEAEIPIVIANQAPPQAQPPVQPQVNLTAQQATELLCSLLLKNNHHHQQQQQVGSSNNIANRDVAQQVGKEEIGGVPMGAATPNPPLARPS